MFWIALAFPHLPLEAAAPGDGRARALVRQHRIACLDAAAAAAGVVCALGKNVQMRSRCALSST